MTETFATYKKRPLIFYCLNLLTISFFAFLIWAWQTNLNVKPQYTPLLIIAVIIGLASPICYVTFTAMGTVKMYKTDGVMVISDDSIEINSVTIPLSQIYKIEILAKDYWGARTSDGSGNWILVEKNSHESFETRFVIYSKEQRDNLKQILSEWQANGLMIGMNNLGFN